MNKSFDTFLWENYPKMDTPLGKTLLNKINTAVDAIDDRVIVLDSTKATKVEVSTLIKEVAFDEHTGIITFTRKNGAVVTIDTPMEKIALNIYYDPVTEMLTLPLIDGTQYEVDLSRLITEYEFLDSDTIAFSISADGKVTAIVKEGSIEEKHLRPDYLADIKVESAKAEASAKSASDSEKNAQKSASDASISQSEAKKSEIAAAESSEEAEIGANTATQKATDAENSAAAAKTSETNAEEFAEESKGAKEGAESAKADADILAASAADSAAVSTTKAGEASGFADMSKSYAVGTGGEVRENDDTDCAEYYYEQAKRISQSISGVVPMGTISFDGLDNIDNQKSGYLFNISDSFISDDRFADGGGIFYGAGSNVMYTADGKWDVLAAAMVSGVKGAEENDFRQGFVSLSPLDVGALPNTTKYAASDSAGGAANNLKGFKTTADNSIGLDPETNAIGYVTMSTPIIGSNKDGMLIAQRYGALWCHEIYGDYRTGQIALRGKNNGGWQSWRIVIDSRNLPNYITHDFIQDALSESTQFLTSMIDIDMGNGNVSIFGDSRGAHVWLHDTGSNKNRVLQIVCENQSGMFYLVDDTPDKEPVCNNWVQLSDTGLETQRNMSVGNGSENGRLNFVSPSGLRYSWIGMANNSGNLYWWDVTNNKAIITSTKAGSNTFHGHASSDLPLTGGVLTGHLILGTASMSDSPNLQWQDKNRIIWAGMENGGGTWYLWDTTNNKAILESNANGNTFMQGTKVTVQNMLEAGGLRSNAGWIDIYYNGQNRVSMWSHNGNTGGFDMKANNVETNLYSYWARSGGDWYVGVRFINYGFNAAAVIPYGDGTQHLGGNGARWAQLWASNATITTSDRNYKEEIEYLSDDDAKDIIMHLKPASFRFKNKEGDIITHDRRHFGFIAQDIEEDIVDGLGISSGDLGFFIKSPTKDIPDYDGDLDYIYSLRYEEFISVAVKTIQTQQKEIESQQKKIDDILRRLDALEAQKN